MNYQDNLCVNTIRVLSAEAVQKANSGHPGLPLGAAPMGFATWKNMNHCAIDPDWPNRDRFILSAGHGSMLEYSLLHLFGYPTTIEDIKNFRQLGSKTPGHPEYRHTVGVETTTGPLGQGIANGVGMAIAETHLASVFNKDDITLVDHYTYVIAGDGCMMEGISSEASSLAGTLKLGKLIVLYDSNQISIEGSTDLAFTEDVAKRYEAYHWQVLTVSDGNDIPSIEEALNQAKSDTRPSLIIISTKIGYGCPAKEGKASAHGEPLGKENVEALKANLGYNYEEFQVPKEVSLYMNTLKENNIEILENWNSILVEYRDKYPLDYKKFLEYIEEIDVTKLEDPKLYEFEKPYSTREASGIFLNRISEFFPNLIGGSADLAPSTKTIMKDKGDFNAQNRLGRNMHFGVREHAMAGISNGMLLHGGLLPYCATFLVFSDYMKGAMRLSSIMEIPLPYVLTHDSIGVGEDGPTHEPIEHIGALRGLPNMTVFRPADSVEAAWGWYYSLTNKTTPTSLILTRQNLPLYKESSKNALKGGYILKDSIKAIPDIILMASGSEVELIYKASEILLEEGIDARVISMPSMELFEKQDQMYKDKVLPKIQRKRLAVEASSDFHWYKYIGIDGDSILMNSFGASGKAEDLFPYFGYTIENVVHKAKSLINKK